MTWRAILPGLPLSPQQYACEPLFLDLLMILRRGEQYVPGLTLRSSTMRLKTLNSATSTTPHALVVISPPSSLLVVTSSSEILGQGLAGVARHVVHHLSTPPVTSTHASPQPPRVTASSPVTSTTPCTPVTGASLLDPRARSSLLTKRIDTAFQRPAAPPASRPAVKWRPPTRIQTFR
jgi:hypothetical protein